MNYVWGQYYKMSTEFKVENLKRLIVYNRVLYVFLLILSLLIRGAKLTENSAIMIYYCLVAIIFLVCDDIIFRRGYDRIEKHNAKFPALLLKIRTFVYVLLLSAGGIIDKMPPVLLLSVIFIIIYVLGQDILFCDIFSTFTNVVRVLSAASLACLFLVFIQYRKDIQGVWLLISVGVSGVMILSLYLIYDFYYRTIMNLDDKYTKLYFENADIIAENSKLIQFREKVEKVNSEINFQKINLTKANDDLAKNNEEARSLIEVMKYFSASFDVEKNANYMLNNVMDIKKTGAVALYIDKDSYMNEEPFTEIISKNEVTRVLLNQDLYDIYNVIRNRKTTDPLVLCDNYDFKYPYLTGGNICNAVAFPAYENENVYGVMVVTSSQYDFFISGYSFYESAIMDFTSALISDRLYLKTEDLAKKDGLTKIYNRIYYNQFYPELVNDVIESGDTLTVCMLDIDHFKSVNDTYGHLAGDEVIKTVARVDDKYAKLYHGYAVRFGGEEFLLILRNVGIDKAYSILKDMHNEIEDTVVEFEDLKININTSMGLASYPETCDDIHEVVDRADKAMYFSKEHGRGMIVIDGRENEHISETESEGTDLENNDTDIEDSVKDDVIEEENDTDDSIVS